MNRRGFLNALGLGAAALTLDPERLLWVPGAKTIFIPKTLAAPPQPFGIYAGMIIMADDIDEAGPVFGRNHNWYRHVTLKRHVHSHNSTLFAIPGGKVEVMIRGVASVGVEYELV